MQALQLSDEEVQQGEEVQLSGLTQELRLMRRSSRVTSASHPLRAAVPSVPRFRPVHEEVTACYSAPHFGLVESMSPNTQANCFSCRVQSMTELIAGTIHC